MSIPKALAGLALCFAVAFAGASAVAKDGSNDPAPKIEMAILLDTSGSMSGLINQARSQIWKVVNEFASATQDGKPPVLHVALYEYGKSSLPAKDGYMRQIVPLTDDLDKISEELFKLQTNGGSEHCGQVIDLAIKELKWSESDADFKCVFIAGNEAFTQGPVDYKEAVKKAIKKGVMVNTIYCGKQNDAISVGWADGAKLADGSFMSIDHNQIAPKIDAPQDKAIAKLNSDLNKTYVAYGNDKQRKDAVARQEAQDKNASSSNVGSTRAQFKASAQYNNARWDLCDACRLGKIKIEDLKEDQLPEFLRKMKVEERKTHIEKMIAERGKIQSQIKKLGGEREKYVAAELQKLAVSSENTLDKAMIEACRKQAAAKNFKFEKK